MRLSVVIPMYNEAAIIKKNLTVLLSALEEKLPGNYEVLAVNDGSTDDTESVTRELSESFPALFLISYGVNRGKGAAVKTGVLKARGDFVLFTDSDLAYGCDMIFTFLDCFEKGLGKIILGSRAISPDGYRGYTPMRRFMSRCYLQLVRTFAGFSYTDSQCGIKGFEKELAHRIFSDLHTDGFAFDLEILLSAKDLNAAVYEQPVKIVNHGSSSIHPVADALKMMKDLYKIKKRRKNAGKSAGKKKQS